MSLSNILINDTKAIFKNLYCNKLNTETLAVDILTADSVTANNDIVSTNGNISATNGDIVAFTGNVTANNDIVSSNGDISATNGDLVAATGGVTANQSIVSTNGQIIATNGNVEGLAGEFGKVTLLNSLTFQTKYVSPATNLTPAPSIALSVLAGTININLNSVIADNASSDITITHGNILADSSILTSVVGASNVGLTLSQKSVALGSMVISIVNTTGAPTSGGTYSFNYMII